MLPGAFKCLSIGYSTTEISINQLLKIKLITD